MARYNFEEKYKKMLNIVMNYSYQIEEKYYQKEKLMIILKLIQLKY